MCINCDKHTSECECNYQAPVLQLDESKRKHKSAYAQHSVLGDTTGMTEGEIVCRINMINSKIREKRIAADKERANGSVKRSYKLTPKK